MYTIEVSGQLPDGNSEIFTFDLEIVFLPVDPVVPPVEPDPIVPEEPTETDDPPTYQPPRFSSKIDEDMDITTGNIEVM